MSTENNLNKLAVVTTESTAITVSNFDDNLLKRWISFVDRTPQTIKTYTASVKRFYRYLQDNGISEPTRQDIIDYRDSMTATLKPSSVKLHINSVKLFFQWLASEGIIERDITVNVHSPKLDNSVHSRDALSSTDAANVLAAMPADNSEKSLRDKCIMALMFCCGLRSIEVCRLDVSDVEVRRGKYFLRVWGKARAGKLDSVSLPKRCYELIKNYLAVRKLSGNFDKKSALFVSTSRRCKNARLETQTVSRLAKKSLKSAYCANASIFPKKPSVFSSNRIEAPPIKPVS